MRTIGPELTAELSPYPQLMDALADAFAKGDAMAPPRVHHTVAEPGGPDRTLLLMPAWGGDAGTVVKLVNVVPGNAERGLAAIQAQVLVADAETGAWNTLIDGATLTARRTAAASALAARYLAPAHARTLLMVGTGRLAPELIAAHRAACPGLARVLIWGRNPAKAEALAAQLGATAVTDLQAACAEADIISCATLAQQVLVQGAWIKPGTHIDLVGAYRKDLRECDTALVRRARVFVDTYAGAEGEAGDLHQAAAEGGFDFAAIEADLQGLTRAGQWPRKPQDITLFKSVGASLEDYVAARLIAANAASAS